MATVRCAAAQQGRPRSRHGAGPRRRVFAPHRFQELCVLPAAGALARVVVSRDIPKLAHEIGVMLHIGLA
jgi:hypothetical protein